MTLEHPPDDDAESKTQQEILKNHGDDRKAIVAVGASAGGLEAFTQLLRALPSDTGLAFVLIQHLDPAHVSQLSEILSRATAMPVSEAADGMAIAPNCVYVIPPNTLMTLEGNILKLEPRQRVRGKYMAIDGFFNSLAKEWGDRAIAVVLSGSNEDGTQGLSAVKFAGGMTFAQDVDSAEFPTMPESAIASGCVDFILPPEAIAAKLVEIGRNVSENANHIEPESQTTDEKALDPEVFLEGSAEAMPQIFALLRSAMRVDFSQYKQGTIRRRISRRMGLHNLDRVEDYVQYLIANPAEIEALYYDILICVTSFFREPNSFEALKSQVFPAICLEKSLDAPIRIWVAGCATGEEAYSIAMCLLEFLSNFNHKFKIQIFATDINELAIEKARAGIYAQYLLAEVSPERLRRFFVPVESGYKISKHVRELCVFAHQNLTSDPPFSQLDLISCRNTLIYVEPALQKKVIPMFHYALNSTGFLMLGSSEGVGGFSDLFAIADKKNRIFVRKLTPHRMSFNFVASTYTARSFNLPQQEESYPDLDLEQIADRIVLNRYAPVGVIINADLDILQFRGQTSAYLEPAAGKASLNLLKMVRSGLALDLQTAIHQAQQENITVRTEGIQLKSGEGWRTVNLDVIPLQVSTTSGGKHPDLGNGYFLVLFEDSPNATIPNIAIASPIPSKPRKVRQTEAELEVQRLTQELAKTKDYLQSIVDAQDSTNQELKVANEEVLSSNEELQSTNEELETAKEEIQATNEELVTINDEMRSRNFQLNQVNNDLHNLLASVNIPILMLSGDLRIRRFTPMAETLFNLISSDVGRPFSDIQPNFHIPNLGALVTSAIDNLIVHEQDIQDQNGYWYSLRIRPYRTTDNKIDGVVIGAIDINSLKRSFIQLESAQNFATAIVETLRQPLVVLNFNLEVISANRAFYQTFRISPFQTEQRSIFDLHEGAWDIPHLRSLLDDILSNNNLVRDFEVEQNFPNLGQLTLLLNACQIVRADTGQTILLAIEDITIRKQQSQQLIAQNESLTEAIAASDLANRVKSQFLANMSHELRTPLTAILGFSKLLQVTENDEAEVLEYLQIIYQSGEHLLALIEDLLDISKIEAEKMEIKASTFSLSDFLRETADTVRLKAENKEILFVTRFDPGLPQTICTDETRLKQVLLNLLSNAIKFTFVGAVTFSVTQSVCKNESNQIVESIQFTVKDTGVGIKTEDLEKIFLPFEQVGDLKSNAQGTGLGLAISQQIVGNLGGQIQVKSTFGEGSTFSFALDFANPAPQIPTQGSDPSDPIDDASGGTHPARNRALAKFNESLAAEIPLQILLAEDTDINQMVVKAWLEHLGYKIDIANNGLEVLNLLRDRTYDVILMDIQMPEMGGVETTQRILAEWEVGSRPYIIAVTANAMPSDRQRYLDAGMDGFVSKPIILEQLVQALRRVPPRPNAN